MRASERFLQALARLVLKIFFRRVEVVGEEHIPLDSPLVLVANHVNGIVDAALLVGTLPVWPRMPMPNCVCRPNPSAGLWQLAQLSELSTDMRLSK